MDKHKLFIPNKEQMDAIKNSNAFKSQNMKGAMGNANPERFVDPEFKALVDAAAQKLRDDRAKLMRYAKRQGMWLMLLVAMWITYEVWIYPILLESVK
jgi:hypothetical protein